MSALNHEKPLPEVVLSKAIIRATSQLGLTQSQIAQTLGIHRTAFSKLKNKPTLSPASKEGELALLVIRIARALYALTGGDEAWIKHFMHSPNKMTGGIPAEQISSIEGLMSVLRFVDGVRGKI